MAYVTQDEMVKRFGETELVTFTDRATPPTGEIDPAVLAEGIQDGEAEVDAYVGARYTLPLPVVPKVLLAMACDVVRHRLAVTSTFCTEEIEKRYDKAIKFLTRVSSGDVSLGITTPAPPADLVETTGPARVFTRESLDGF